MNELQVRMFEDFLEHFNNNIKEMNENVGNDKFRIVLTTIQSIKDSWYNIKGVKNDNTKTE